jgi:acetylornithine aminotransferase
MEDFCQCRSARIIVYTPKKRVNLSIGLTLAPHGGAFRFMEPEVSHLMATYSRLPIAFERGEGVWLWDTAGNRYLDALGGVAVMTLGHTHPDVVAAITEQAGKLVHTSNWFEIVEQEKLAAAICRVSGMERVFFCNSGAEANEAAIKLARLYGEGKGVNNPTIVVTQDAFHGRTLSTLSAGGNRSIQAGFEPLLTGFKRVPYDDLEAIQDVAANNSDVVAVLVEPILGESGIIIPHKGYLAGIRKICDQNGWLMMLDEVQTGIGRTGEWFAYQHEDLLPDVVTLAKALGSGIPIGACAARGHASTVLGPGSHGSTFGGNALASRVGRTVIEVMERDKLVPRAAQMGKYLLGRLKQVLINHPLVSDVRGKGLMLAVSLKKDIPDLQKIFLEAGLLVSVTGGGSIVRYLPPAIITNQEADQVANISADVLSGLGSG